MFKMKELRLVAEYYAAALPGWTVMGRDCIVRESGPVLQGINLYRKSYDEIFTVLPFVHTLVVPADDVRFDLAEFLSHPNGAPDLAAHRRDWEAKREVIVAEMHRQMRPRIDRPLDPREVAGRYAKMPDLRFLEAESIAAIYAYLGEDRRARKWCRTSRKRLDVYRGRLGDRPFLNSGFLEDLERWLAAGEAGFRLEELLAGERRKLGLG